MSNIITFKNIPIVKYSFKLLISIVNCLLLNIPSNATKNWNLDW